MKRASFVRGQSLLELMLALALGAGVIALAASAAARSGDALHASQSELEARSSVRGCIDAVRSIRDQSFSDIAHEGEYALIREGNIWSLEPNIPLEYAGPVVTVEDAPHGAYDITCSIARASQFMAVPELSLTTRITNWRQNAGAQHGVSIRLSEATVSSTSDAVADIQLCNDSDDVRTLTGVRLMWEGEPVLTSLTRAGIEEYGPDANIVSDTSLPLPSLEVVAGSCVTFDSVRFDSELETGHLFFAAEIDDTVEVTRHVYLSLI